MVIFNSYVSLPEGNHPITAHFRRRRKTRNGELQGLSAGAARRRILVGAWRLKPLVVISHQLDLFQWYILKKYSIENNIL
jgi:hypothetical protein